MENKKPSLRAVLTTSVFLAVLGGFFLLNRLIAPPDILASERRAPAALPALTGETLRSAEFMSGFESYAADSFVFRDGLRTVRAATVFYIFQQTDKSGLYRGETGAGKFEKLNETSLRQAAQKINLLAASLDGLNLYCAVVPDKSLYAGRYLPGFDPESVRRILGEELDGLTPIDLTPALAAEDFYRTDLHWDQTRLSGVTGALGGAMGFDARADYMSRALGAFQGVYAGQLALPMGADTMAYLTNGAIDGASARYLNPRTGALEDGPVYDEAAFAGQDPYDVFLRGAQPLVILENPSAQTDRELYLFRDSFSSSLAPLLLSAYARVTLIDLRYIDSRVLPEYVTFTPGADVLFLYSSQILTNATALLVNG
ncbi:MAG: hypothetical protein LBT12_04880 [Oscillospiraceae bacterium]|jgi:hypothetical protein|nr:hypothetical protein [Oscillospiraceae bacterium]